MKRWISFLLSLIFLFTVTGCGRSEASSAESGHLTAISFVDQLKNLFSKDEPSAVFADPTEKDDSSPELGDYHHRGYTVADGVALITYSDRETDELKGVLVMEDLDLAMLKNTTGIGGYLMGCILAYFESDPQAIADKLDVSNLSTGRSETATGDAGTYNYTFNPQTGYVCFELILNK